ncbi:hypothetical protein Tco_1509313 [Tanacetum coccineum]
METFEPAILPMVEKSKLDEDLQGKAVDPIRYRGMIGTLMYLTSSRLDLVFVVYMCARYQAKPTEKDLHAVKRIFRYLRGTINMGLWYLKDSCIALTAFADADYGRDEKKRLDHLKQDLKQELHEASYADDVSTRVDDDFGVDVFLFQTCLTDILGFLEKLELLFEQDIDVEEGRFEGDEDGGEV